MNWWEQPVLSLDLETTGADPHECEVVQWAAARVAPNGRILEAHAGIVQTRAWSPEAEGIHGITREESALGMTTFEMTESIRGAIHRANARREPVVAFNAPYDLTILARLMAFPASGAPLVLDPLVMDRGCVPRRKGKGARQLGKLAVAYGIPVTGAHDALADALSAARLAFAMAEQHERLRTRLSDLQAAQVAWASEWASGFQAYKRRTGDPSAVVDGSWPIRQSVGVVS